MASAKSPWRLTTCANCARAADSFGSRSSARSRWVFASGSWRSRNSVTPAPSQSSAFLGSSFVASAKASAAALWSPALIAAHPACSSMPTRGLFCAISRAPATTAILNIQANHTHQFERIAMRDDAVADLVIKRHLAIFDLVLQMDIFDTAREDRVDFGQRQIVRRHHADRTTLEHGPDDALGGDAAILGVGAAQQLVEQEQHGQWTVEQVADRADAQRLG